MFILFQDMELHPNVNKKATGMKKKLKKECSRMDGVSQVQESFFS